MAKSYFYPGVMLLSVLVVTMMSTASVGALDAGLVDSVCNATLYKDVCVKSLNESGSGDTSDPKEILKMSFKVTKDQIIKGLNESKTIKEAKNDSMTAEALEICRQVMEYAVNDLERTINSSADIKMDNLDVFVEDLRVWIGGVITYEEVCFDAFQNTTTDAGKKIREFFNQSRKLSSNALTIVTELKEFLSQYKDLESTLGGLLGRRLLEKKTGFIAGEAPAWVNSPKRKVMGVPVGEIKADAVVAQDGSGQHKTLKEALAKVPKKSMEPFIIHLKAGTYKEYNVIPKDAWNVILVGDGPDKTIISGDKSFAKKVQTFHTAPLGVDGDGFMARDIKFENTAGPSEHQAVALRVAGDLAVFHNCRFDGAQDTLYSMRGRQFYRDCTITGTVDFIFGDAQAVYQNCQIIVNKPDQGQDCEVTAQGRTEAKGPGAFVIQGCRITGSDAYKSFKNAAGKSTYLGRPWKPYSRTIVMNSFIDGIISPEGWQNWPGSSSDKTAEYSEFQNQGPGADTSKRVQWAKQLSAQDAENFTPAKLFLNPDAWIANTGVPFASGTFSVK